MDQLGELVPEFAGWLQQKGVEQWCRAHNAHDIGNSIRSLICQSIPLGHASAPSVQGFQTATGFDFMLSH